MEQRDRYAPAFGQINEEGLRLLGSEFTEVQAKFKTYVLDWPRTDYIVLGE